MWKNIYMPYFGYGEDDTTSESSDQTSDDESGAGIFLSSLYK